MSFSSDLVDEFIEDELEAKDGGPGKEEQSSLRERRQSQKVSTLSFSIDHSSSFYNHMTFDRFKLTAQNPLKLI